VLKCSLASHCILQRELSQAEKTNRCAYLVVNICPACRLIPSTLSFNFFCVYSITQFYKCCHQFKIKMAVSKSSITGNGVMVVVYGFVSSREARPLGGTLVATTIQPAPLLLTPHSTPCCRRGVSRPTRLLHT
jgi:hypothetical protein